MAVALTRLGNVALAENDPAYAQELYARSMTLYQQVHDPGGLAATYLGAAKAEIALHNGRSACQHLAKALKIAHEMNFVTLILSVLNETGRFFADNGRSESADVIFATVAHHPAAPHVIQLQTSIGKTTPQDLETVVSLAQQELTQLAKTFKEAADTHVETAVQQANQALIEPLTPRELEILQHIAAGMTNREIAEALVVVVGTIKAHTNRIYGKLGVRSRTQAIARAQELRLI
jgi:LuxR family maltose regulon positive regulatory protein